MFVSLGGVNQLSSSQAVGQPGALTAEVETAVLPWLCMNACYAVVHSSHGKSSSGFLFMFTTLLIRASRGNDKGRAQRERNKNGLWPIDELSLPILLFLSSVSSFFALSLFCSACLGCLPFSFALITALVNCVSEPK